LFHLTRRENPWERGCHFGQILARNCSPSPRLLIESSPRFTNLCPVRVLPVQSAFYYMPNLNEKFILLKNSSDRIGLEFFKTRIGSDSD
jgi:hypothetical protein